MAFCENQQTMPWHYAECCYSECPFLLIVMLNAIMLSVNMLSVVEPFQPSLKMDERLIPALQE
jgi:hypothetical protein